MRSSITATVVFAVALAACSSGGGGGSGGGAAPTVATATPSSAAGPTTTTTATMSTTTTTAASAVPARPSPGCGTSTVRALDAQRRTLTVGGDARWYLLTTPPAHDGRTPLPLVLDFHGLAEGAQIHTQMSSFGALAQRKGFVVAFPNGTGTPVRWLAPGSPTGNPDLAFVDALLGRLGRDLCIDTARVYAAGLSNGAFMASLIGCARANRFAAVAPVAGVTFASTCAPSRPMPLIAFHGTADPILRFNGGFGGIPGITPAPPPGSPTTTLPPADLDGAGYPAAVASWAARNGCGATPTDTNIGTDVVHRVYRCPAGRDVEFYIVRGGGHAWPGSKFSRSIVKIVGPTTFTIDATDVIWRFFTRFALPAS